MGGLTEVWSALIIMLVCSFDESPLSQGTVSAATVLGDLSGENSNQESAKLGTHV